MTPEVTHQASRVRDVLETLAQLPNDEVFTAPWLASAMLDLLPAGVWTEPKYRWLDPVSKSGVFLREAAKRLMIGLAEWEPNPAKRREHIYKNMLFGCATTQLTGEVSRRSVYHSKDATGAGLANDNLRDLMVRFDDPDGNIPFIQTDHTFDATGKCTVCKAPRDLERGLTRENYAYPFNHGTYPTKEMRGMKFDVIVGNPPYQIDSDGNTRTMPIYQLFVERAIAMNPRYVAMITPSRWFAGGLGLDTFRAKMLRDKRFVHFVDYPQAKDCFPGVKVRGGVSYFLWSREHKGDCTIRTVRGQKVGEAMTRSLDAYDVFVRYNEGIRVLEKVRASGDPTMESKVSSLVPFGLRAKFRDYVDPNFPKAVALHIMGRKVEWIDPKSITNNWAWVGMHKTLLHAAYGEDHDGPYTVIAQPTVAKPNSACTETYLVIGAFNTAEQARNLDAYLRTKFARFLIWLRMNTQHVNKDKFKFVPDLDMKRAWTDQDLYKRYALTEDEIAFIESQIRQMAPAS